MSGLLTFLTQETHEGVLISLNSRAKPKINWVAIAKLQPKQCSLHAAVV